MGRGIGLAFWHHRSILEIPVEKTVRKTAQLPLPTQALPSPQQVTQTKSEPARKIVWADCSLMQPERWSVSLHSPQRGVTAEYFVGNRFVKLDQVDAVPIGTLLAGLCFLWSV